MINIGFEWDPKPVTWDEHMRELEAFHAEYGNIDGPFKPLLAQWIVDQVCMHCHAPQLF